MKEGRGEEGLRMSEWSLSSHALGAGMMRALEARLSPRREMSKIESDGALCLSKHSAAAYCPHGPSKHTYM